MNMNLRIFVVIFLGFISLKSNATLIEYELSHISGSRYQYEYTITNDSISDGIQWFTIYFDELLYSNLSISSLTSVPSDWKLIARNPEPYVSYIGYFDAYSFGEPISLNESLGGFVVEFDWLSAGLPGEQLFDISDASLLASIDSGFTSSLTSSDHSAIPEPSTLFITILFLFGLWIKHSCVGKGRNIDSEMGGRYA